MARVEDARTHMDNNQVRLVARSVEDPSKLGDMMPVGFGDAGGGSLVEEEKVEGGMVNTEGKKDGFVSTLTRMVSILPERKPGHAQGSILKR